MKNGILMGLWRRTLPIPRAIWQSQVRGDADLRFMTDAHHLVRDYVVRELPRVGEPLSPELVAREVKLPLDQVTGLLDDLERNMTFLYRNEEGAVHWAYPVTVDETPHRMSFSTGEQVNAA
jgi:hypothetical protein